MIIKHNKSKKESPMKYDEEIKRILETIDLEFLDSAKPATNPSDGMKIGGLVFVATKDDTKSNIYEKGEHFTLVDILGSDENSPTQVQMARNSDGSLVVFDATSPFTLVGS
jgi:hypothetical protein